MQKCLNGNMNVELKFVSLESGFSLIFLMFQIIFWQIKFINIYLNFHFAQFKWFVN